MTHDDPSYDYGYRHAYRQRREPPFAADARHTGGRFLRYLRSRPAESWLFFAAGFLLATIVG